MQISIKCLLLKGTGCPLERHARISQTVKKTSVTFVTFADGFAQTAKEINISKVHHSRPSVTSSFVSSFYKP